MRESALSSTFSKPTCNPGDLIRFHSGTNGYYGNVIWKGNQYQAYPIAVEGFESKNEGTYARPSMAVANVTGLLTGINHDFDDMLGVVITRRQVPVKYLDAVNFPNGNPDADPTQEAVSRYVVEEMTEETFEQVTYTLATPIDCDNAIIPARTILADVCQWQYRGVGCGYDGPPVADERDNPTTDPAKDNALTAVAAAASVIHDRNQCQSAVSPALRRFPDARITRLCGIVAG
jgi:lambda family phage minor tail protein L